MLFSCQQTNSLLKNPKEVRQENLLPKTLLQSIQAPQSKTSNRFQQILWRLSKKRELRQLVANLDPKTNMLIKNIVITNEGLTQDRVQQLHCMNSVKTAAMLVKRPNKSS
jgi:hypothetical protein